MANFEVCQVCGEEILKEIKLNGKSLIVGIACKCQRERRKAQEQEEQEQIKKEARHKCFGSNSTYYKWTFENDDRANAKISDAMQKYCELFPKMYADGQGLLIFGSVGTGKTYLAACIANRLIDNGESVYMSNFATLTNKMQASFDARQEVIDEICKYKLLIIDDLGIERNTDYMNEIVFNIIDSRYQTGKPIIFTTNLTGADFENIKDISKARIYDRVLERCLPVKLDGESRRKRKLKATAKETRALLGI